MAMLRAQRYPAQAVAVTVSRRRKTPSPDGNLPSDRYLTHCSYSLQHRLVRYYCSDFFSKLQALFSIFFRKVAQLGKSRADRVVILLPVREKTGRAVLYALRRVGKAAAAARAERVERAEAEQAVKVLRIGICVAGEVFARPVLKITVTHGLFPILSPNLTRVSMPCAL